jgi:peptide/nickel transport system ATP-binding protein
MRRLWGRELFLFPQEPGVYLNPLRRSNRQVDEVFRWIRKLGRSGSRTRGRELLNRAGLSAVRDGRKYPWQLSGGMNQRLLTAITLAEPARLVLADEPTKGLDLEMKHLTVDLMLEISANGKSLFVITHDLEVAEKLGGDLAVMYGGVIVEAGPARDVLDGPRHPYTRALLASLPQNGLNPIPLAPNGAGPNTGCVFAPRCAQAESPCFDNKPPGNEHHHDRRFCRCHFHC